jgi:hypothetical protein
VFLPDCSVSHGRARVEEVAEPELPGADAEPVIAFEVMLDGDTSFGNPQFVVGRTAKERKGPKGEKGSERMKRGEKRKKG